MQLRTRLALTLGGLLASILIVSTAGSIATGDLANRIETLHQAALLDHHVEKIERARRQYQISGLSDDLELARDLIVDASDKIIELKRMSHEDDSQAALIPSLQQSFERYQQLLDAYADSERHENNASNVMAAQLGGLKVMATELKRAKESDYHRHFASATSIKEAEGRLKTTLRLTALANEIIVIQMSIERAVALYQAGRRLGAADISIEIGRIAEVADRIRRIEEVAADGHFESANTNLPDQLAERSNQFQDAFDDFRLATRDQTARAKEMADVAIEVTQLIEKINTLQTEAAITSSNWTLTLSLLGVATALILGGLASMILRNRLIAPLTAITRTMLDMSNGQLAVAVPGHERSDELGAMANALEIFRKNSLEARRLAEENIDVERRLAAEKAEAVFLETSLSREKELNAQQRRFVSLVSHEFRTPLAIIDGHAQRLIRRGDKLPPEKRIMSLENIRESISRLTDLMESILSSASLEAGSIAYNPEPMDLKTLIQKACEGQQEISTKHRFNVDIDDLPNSFLGDPKLLHQVAANLLSNAVKYSPEADRVDIVGSSTADSVTLTVRDFGVGIPTDEIPKLFQRFFRARTSSGIQGTGIGLNLVKSLIEMHGGTMEVSSIEGEGSTFTINLPHKMPAEDRFTAVA